MCFWGEWWWLNVIYIFLQFRPKSSLHRSAPGFHKFHLIVFLSVWKPHIPEFHRWNNPAWRIFVISCIDAETNALYILYCNLFCCFFQKIGKKYKLFFFHWLISLSFFEKTGCKGSPSTLCSQGFVMGLNPEKEKRNRGN